MNRTQLLKSAALAIGLPMLYLVDLSPEAPPGLTLVRQAHALVGAPATPLSVAGVARRTTARAVVATEATAASQQQAVAQQQAATAQQQQAVAQQQTATAQQQAAAQQPKPAAAPQPQPQAAPAAAPSPAGAPAVGSIVNALPAGCVQEARGGVEYQKCGSVYYRAAFQGNNLVYVVQQP